MLTLGLLFVRSKCIFFCIMSRLSEQMQTVCKAIRQSPSGEEMVLKKNIFIERFLPSSIIRKLSDEEMAVYKERYKSA